MIDRIIDEFPDEEIVVANNLNFAIIGFDTKDMRVIYSVEKIIEYLIEVEEMPDEDAYEYFLYNIHGAYVGERTPIWSFTF
jgi:hypothetical protein